MTPDPKDEAVLNMARQMLEVLEPGLIANRDLMSDVSRINTNVHHLNDAIQKLRVYVFEGTGGTKPLSERVKGNEERLRRLEIVVGEIKRDLLNLSSEIDSLQDKGREDISGILTKVSTVELKVQQTSQILSNRNRRIIAVSAAACSIFIPIIFPIFPTVFEWVQMQEYHLNKYRQLKHLQEKHDETTPRSSPKG